MKMSSVMLGAVAAMSLGCVSGSAGSFESSPRKSNFKLSPKKTVTTASEYRADSNKLAKRLSKGKRLFRA